jgi:hypothetical protein
MKLIFWL